MNPLYCPFCQEFTDPAAFRRDTLPEWPFEDRLIAVNKGAALIPTLGPVVPRTPYVLAIPRGCSHSFLDTPAAEQEAVFDLIDRLTAVESLYPKGMSLIFEHGGTKGEMGCKCVSHCHLHVMNVVGPWGILPAELCSRYKTERFDMTVEASHPGTPAPYLFAGFYERGTRIIRGSFAYVSDQERQFFRRAIAELAGQSDYDYRQHMHMGTMLDTYRLAREGIKDIVST